MISPVLTLFNRTASNVFVHSFVFIPISYLFPQWNRQQPTALLVGQANLINSKTKRYSFVIERNDKASKRTQKNRAEHNEICRITAGDRNCITCFIKLVLFIEQKQIGVVFTLLPLFLIFMRLQQYVLGRNNKNDGRGKK